MKTIYFLLILSLFSSLSFSQDSLKIQKQYQVIFQNWSGRDIEVVIKYFSLNGENWEITDWLYLVTGEEKTLVFTQRSHFYYYAKFSNGGGSWSGGYYQKVGRNKLGMRLVDIEKNNSIQDSLFILRLE
jgi:hypothetical protein